MPPKKKIQKKEPNKAAKYAWAQMYSSESKYFKFHSEYFQSLEKMKKEFTPEIPKHFVNQYLEAMNKLKETITCTICSDIIDENNLKITSCGHLFCEECLISWAKSCKEKNNQVTCPTCRHKISVKEN